MAHEDGAIMVAEWAAGLALASGSALLAAAATDAWQTARTGFARLLGRGDQRQQELAEAQLDELAAVIAAVNDSHRDRLRAQMLPLWQARLAALLRDDPQIARQVEHLGDRVRAALPGTEREWADSIAAGAGLTPGANVTTGGVNIRDSNAVVGGGKVVDHRHKYRIGSVRFGSGGLAILIIGLVVLLGGTAGIVYGARKFLESIHVITPPAAVVEAEAHGESPWTVEGYGIRYSVVSATRTTSDWMETKPSITVTAYVTRTEPHDFSSIGYRISDQSSGSALDAVPFQGGGDRNPPINQPSKIVSVVWDTEPRATLLTITLHDFYWPDGKDLVLRNVPVQGSMQIS